jgi:hypothetical protein
MDSVRLELVKRVGSGLAIIIFPIVFIILFAVHPNLFNIAIENDVNVRIGEFHGNAFLHLMHFIMLICVPIVIVVALKLVNLLKGRGAWFGFIGGVMAIIGAIVLAVDKTALCLVPSAFDTLSEAQFLQLVPGIDSLFAYKGYLFVIWLLPLLPLGFVVQGIGLYVSRILPRWQSIMIIIGAFLLANPDIDLISLTGSIFIAIGMLPLGLNIVRNNKTAISYTEGSL